LSSAVAFDFTGKRVLITGASRGIGYSVAQAFVAAGAEVAILAEQPEVFDSARQLQKQGGRTVTPILCDITQGPLLRKSVATLQSLDIVVANAGTGDITPIDAAGDELDATFERLIRINLLGAFNTVRATLPLMSHGGRLLFTSSVHGQRIAPPGMSAYAASKGGLEAMMRSLARELGPRGITVNAVAPGMVATELTLGAIRKLFGAQLGEAGGRDEQAMIRELNAGQAIHNAPVDPGRLAQAYLFLASDAGAAITGQSVNVDHGLAM
jgi:NAD(P)-dependent dehydrogenase (short-subunit alcohol dehydrogenase family)